MKNILFYAIVMFVFSIVQTVLIPTLFDDLSSGWFSFVFSHLTIDLFMILAFYFAFNRNFFHGFVWNLSIYIVSSGLGYTWSSANIVALMVCFLIIQGSKIHFAFQHPSPMRVAVFLLSILYQVIYIRVGAGIMLGSLLSIHLGSLLLTAFVHGLIAPWIYYALTEFDARTIYRFEIQRTLFTTPIR